MTLYDAIRNIVPSSVRKRLRNSPFLRFVAKMAGRQPGPRTRAPQYEPQVCAAIRRLVRPGWVCVDAGANVGIITALLAEIVGDAGKVVAFEAFPDNARVLKEQMQALRMGNRVIVENMAVSDGASDRLWLYAGRKRWSAEWNIMGHDVEGSPTEAELEIPASSLDQYFPAGSQVDFVKMDIEGAAALALPGMRRILREQSPVMLMEFHDEPEWAARKELLEAGYQLYSIEGRLLDAERDTARQYHCVALPRNKSWGAEN